MTILDANGNPIKSAPIPDSDSDLDSDDSGCNQFATNECKRAMFIWCIAGGIYAAKTWHLIWLPAVLIFIPGIFIASIVAAIFAIPVWLITQRAKKNYEKHYQRSWGLLIAATAVRIFGFVASVVGSVFYVKLLRHFIA